MKSRPESKAKPPEVTTERLRLGVSPVDLSSFSQLVEDDGSDGDIGRRSPCGKRVASQVVKPPSKALKLGGEPQDHCGVQALGPPAPTSTGALHQLVGGQQLVESIAAVGPPVRQRARRHDRKGRQKLRKRREKGRSSSTRAFASAGPVDRLDESGPLGVPTPT